MLLSPGETFNYNGQQLTYPHVRLVYWAGEIRFIIIRIWLVCGVLSAVLKP